MNTSEFCPHGYEEPIVPALKLTHYPINKPELQHCVCMLRLKRQIFGDLSGLTTVQPKMFPEIS